MHPLAPKRGLIGFSTRGTFPAIESLALLVGVIRSIAALLVGQEASSMIVISAVLFAAGVNATI